MRILQLASEHIHPMRTHGRGWSLRVEFLGEIRIVRWKHKEFTAFPRCDGSGRKRLLIARARETQREKCFNPVTPINTCYYTVRRTVEDLSRALPSARMEIRRGNAKLRTHRGAPTIKRCRKLQVSCFVVTMRRRCGWIKLICLETSNRMFHRAKEINERDVLLAKKKIKKKRSSRENVENGKLDMEWNPYYIRVEFRRA